MRRARGELEQDVMTALWAHREPVTARAVLRTIDDPDLAYTTVKTVLERLTRKQVVTRVNIDRTWHYSPAASRDDYVAELMLRALDRTGDRDGALVRFAQTVTPAEAEVLRAALETPDR
ncbi:BlaI/MecI/CopY family transcriptional regulator [Pseudonocardia cypriaca]|uniref:Putative transcriptional regulator n=1 Tax=Pseudonocardia cypriaca TaxID=882449 RepID=A0A543FVG7_9PSEU|nr:BlaI/MecI/CopY family transcriptional regulator [Pseudonocardia cypriaca]TQM37848.1 putative transcriptional regulator [Pseudonocardia cypriaca]